MHLPMLMPQQAFVQVEDMSVTVLHYQVWSAEHLRIRLLTLAMLLLALRLSIISQKSGKLSHCVGWVSIRCWPSPNMPTSQSDALIDQ
jgi:hypothetical protein